MMMQQTMSVLTYVPVPVGWSIDMSTNASRGILNESGSFGSTATRRNGRTFLENVKSFDRRNVVNSVGSQ